MPQVTMWENEEDANREVARRDALAHFGLELVAGGLSGPCADSLFGLFRSLGNNRVVVVSRVESSRCYHTLQADRRR